MKIIVVHPNGSTKMIEVEMNSTLKEAKRRIETYLGLNLKDYSLCFGSTILNNEKDGLTIKQIGIEDSGMIHIIPLNLQEVTNSNSMSKVSIERKINEKGSKARLGSTGKYYCGELLDYHSCKCCNGFCGPTNGCNCSACMKLDLMSRNLPKGWLVNREGFQSRKGRNGLFYCGRRVLVGTPYCDGYCGPTDGPNCYACAQLDWMTSYNGRRYSYLI
jgi:hypothetical protein